MTIALDAHARSRLARGAIAAPHSVVQLDEDTRAAHARVARWYDDKTEAILAKYGPGPRVHFHAGMVEADALAALARTRDASVLQRALCDSQESLLGHAAQCWNAPRSLSQRVLDVGCGLGGGALYWAQEYGARVTALSNVQRHLDTARALAARTPVHHRVSFVHGDAHAPPEGLFEAAVAIESSVYFHRESWFRALRGSLTRGGFVFIGDTFSDDPALVEEFNAYWLCQLGHVQQYREAARRAGFTCVSLADVSVASSRFWELSALWIEAQLGSGALAPDESVRLRRSLEWHRTLARAYEVGRAQNLFLAFQLV